MAYRAIPAITIQKRRRGSDPSEDSAEAVPRENGSMLISRSLRETREIKGVGCSRGSRLPEGRTGAPAAPEVERSAPEGWSSRGRINIPGAPPVRPMSKEGWNTLAAWRDSRMGERGDLWHRAIIDPTLLSLVGPVRGLRVLDVGCGNGYLTRRWAREGARESVGVDASEA